MGKKISSFRDLIVYQKAFKLQQDIFNITQEFPREEIYSLVDQIRRSSRSIGASISEAWYKRRYVAHFTSKLTDANSEQGETQHWLDTALVSVYIPEDKHKLLRKKCDEVGKILSTMIRKPEKFCLSTGS